MDKENINWTTVTPEVWKPEKPGEQITGVLTNKTPKTDKISARYYVKNKAGVQLLWGSAVLDHRLLSVEPGTPVRITYMGVEKNSKNQDMKMFEVEVPEKDSAPAPATEAGNQPPISIETIGELD